MIDTQSILLMSDLTAKLQSRLPSTEEIFSFSETFTSDVQPSKQCDPIEIVFLPKSIFLHNLKINF